ncbi:MAG: hypothetical protein R3F31_18070 [Verrucomicrobiales bacterium]
MSGVGVLTTDAAGTTTLNAGSVSATTVTLNDDVTLGSNVTVTATTATFNGNLAGEAMISRSTRPRQPSGMLLGIPSPALAP